MELFLLLVVIVLLILQNAKHSKESLSLRKEISILNDKVNKLLAHYKAPDQTATKKIIREDVLKNPVEPVVERPLKATQPIPKIIKEERVAEPVKISASFQTPITAPNKRVEQKPKPSFWKRFKQKNPDLEKFIGENLINKIGILILVLGISYFVKFAIDKDWINEPARVGIGILAGSLVLFIAHKLRKKYAPFSSVLVAGALAVFYFTIAIAFHEYQLFSQQVAFGIMVVITAFSCLISLSYNRMELAILSLIGGFLVPFMVSSGSGNYVVLFTYIAILDVGILALAYFKKWHAVHILAFVFTMVLFSGWMATELNAEAPDYLGALVFAFVFYLLFIITNIINNLRNKGSLSKIQLVMLSVNNFIFYGIGMLILANYKPELSGLFTALLAVLNLVYAWVLYKKFGLDKIAVYLLIGLTLTFITLAIPVQFSGNNITMFWAAEAVLLMWLAQKSQIKSYRFATVLVQFLMLISLLMDWPRYFETTNTLIIVLNPIFIGGVFVVASMVIVGYLLRNETEKLLKFGFKFHPQSYRNLIHILAIITGYFVGFFEVSYQSVTYFSFNDFLAIIALYHLLFSLVFCFIFYRNRTLSRDKMINSVAVLNILLFAFLFSSIPFIEHKDNIMDATNSHMAYYLHFVSISFVLYFWYLIYTTNKTEKVFSIFKHRWILWFVVFIIVFMASKEVILHGLYMIDYPIDQSLKSSSYVTATDLMDASRSKIIKTGLPILWGVLAFVLLLWGIKKQIKPLRISALTLLGITIVKLFVYDISNVSETGKIIAFILLGVLILIISFVYQKIKVLVIDEDKTPKHD
ncbi:DUF2339 domain-containing protein [Mariniflexile ostreae]|uniref:DUF2339 domain-containing protein n=1 Tax=Mariniflexile ostreae TaxID=1520892 RepID=A0ABV5FEA4_9FLAO